MTTITRAHLNQLADFPDAKLHFGELLQLLVRNTESDRCVEARFLFGATENRPGFDGQVVLRELPGRPAHSSLWELGTVLQTKTIGKIRDDFVKSDSRALPTGWDRGRTTYVAATLRNVGNPAALEDELLRNAENPWGRVKVLAADELAEWIGLCPPVENWLVNVLGLQAPLRFGQAMADRWRTWSGVTTPPISAELMTAGRDVASIKDWFSKENPPPLVLMTDSIEESAALVCAVAGLLAKDDYENVKSSALFISDKAQAQAYALHRFPAGVRPITVLLPPASEVVQLFPTSHRLVVVSARGSPGSAQEIKRALRQEFEKALHESMGLPLPKAQAEAKGCSASPSVWRAWNLITGANASSVRPWWATAGNVHLSLPALLLRAWEREKAGDKEILELFLDGAGADRYYERLTWHLNSDQPYLEDAGGVLSVIGPAVAFLWLGPHITRRHLDSLTVAVKNAFSEIEPEVNSIWEGKEIDAVYTRPNLKYSERARDGLAEVLLLIAVHGHKPAGIPEFRTPLAAEEFIVNLARTAGIFRHPRSLVAFREQLPTLAEAAPDFFLSALEDMLQGDPSLFEPMLVKEDSGVFSRWYGSGINWALQTLAWEPTLLARVTSALGQLAARSLGSHENMFARTLRTIYLAWSPGTSAAIAQRVEALEQLSAEVPDVAWTTLVALLPKHFDTSSPTSEPRWRDFGRSERPVLTVGMVREAHLAYLNLNLKMVAGNLPRSLELLDAYAELPQNARSLLLESLRGLAGPASSEAIWYRLRKFWSHHVSFQHAEWALSPNELEPLKALVDELEPEDVLVRNRYLFDEQWPDTDYPAEDISGKEKDNEDRRLKVVNQVSAQYGLSGLDTLVRASRYAYLVGQTVGRSTLPLEDKLKLGLMWIERADRSSLAALSSLVAVVTSNSGVTFAEQLADQTRGLEAAPEAVAAIFQGRQENAATYEALERESMEIQNAYWRAFSWGIPATTPSEKNYVVTKLLAVGRASEVLRTLPARLNGIEPKLAMETLEALKRELETRDVLKEPMFVWYFRQFIGWMRAQESISREALVREEYYFLPLLIDGLEKTNDTLLLHQYLASDPEFFVRVISDLYRSRSETEQASSNPVEDEGRTTRAMSAYRLLKSWNLVPGTGGGKFSPIEMSEWIAAARQKAALVGRTEMADHHIGAVLYHDGRESLGSWLSEAVMATIEGLASPDIERGFETESYNSRGVTMRAPLDGGAQEKVLAELWEARLEAVPHRFPRVRSLYRKIASGWLEDAIRHDAEAARLRLEWT